MRVSWLRLKYSRPPKSCSIPRRSLLTLAIETSCDDTSVAILEKHKNNSATLHFHSKITSDNRAYGGVHPTLAHESHQKRLAGLVNDALKALPMEASAKQDFGKSVLVRGDHGVEVRRKPDFVTVTRGPGMRASLITGVDTAKGLAVAWQVPFLGVNHMLAHALTPRMVSALDAAEKGTSDEVKADPGFPLLTLLVSGGHTMLVHSRGLCDHEILANTSDIAIGDMIDKCARDILPPSVLESSSSVMFGPVLERFAFPDHTVDSSYQPPANLNDLREARNSGYDWSLPPPYSQRGQGGSWIYPKFMSFSGIGSSVKRVVDRDPEISKAERRTLAREVMRVSFEHLASRVLLALKRDDTKFINTLVVSGGVAGNHYLKHVFRSILDAQGYSDLRLIFPPPKFCTDNAAMIAWTGIEIFEAGWRTDLSALAVRKWSIDPTAEDGGIFGLEGWRKNWP